MAFRFNFAKAIQATGVLLRMEPDHCMTRLRLIKLLYIADRTSLKDTGQPITGDRIVAMEHGPVLSFIYDCIKGERDRAQEWGNYFSSEPPYFVRIIKQPALDELCPYEIEVLQRIAQERHDKDEWEVVEETHHFPEWIKNDPGTSSRIIPTVDVLNAVGRGGQAEKILQEAEDEARLDRLFRGAC